MLIPVLLRRRRRVLLLIVVLLAEEFAEESAFLLRLLLSFRLLILRLRCIRGGSGLHRLYQRRSRLRHRHLRRWRRLLTESEDPLEQIALVAVRMIAGVGRLSALEKCCVVRIV